MRLPGPSPRPHLAGPALALTLALSPVLVSLAACGRSQDGAPPSSAAAVPVETAQVAAEDVDVVVQAVGTLEAEQAIELKARRAGQVGALYENEGASVEQGTLLVQLDDRDLAAHAAVARARLVNAEVRARNATRAFERLERLRREGVASEQSYDDARAEHEQAAAGLEVARADLAFAEAELAKMKIVAPFAGVLGRRRVDLGAYVKEGETLGSLIDLDPVEIVFAVPERYAARLSRGQRVEAQVASHADLSFPGGVTYVDAEVDRVNRTVTVKAELPNPEQALKPGQFASVVLRLDRHEHAAVIPEDAIVPVGERTMVFVVEGGSARAREIATGVRLPGRVEVVSGLAPGETIVRTGHEKLELDTPLPVVEVRIDDPGARAHAGGVGG